MKKTLNNLYQPSQVESSFHQRIFKTAQKSKNSFVLLQPPPNITGHLHIGHALTLSIEDFLCRYHSQTRQCQSLFIPGTDHAGIATQVQVEKQMKKDDPNFDRHIFGREKFIEKIQQWKNEKEEFIFEQQKKMGVHFYDDLKFFTMDQNLQESVKQSFIQLHQRDIIYRDNRLVNWSCSLKSAISDIEVEYKEIDGFQKLDVPGYDKKIQFGEMVYFKYIIVDQQGEYQFDQIKNNPSITVATTRIETILGDQAVCVHPEDKRYTDIHGKFCFNPFNNKCLPIIPDTMVDMEFGTGCVKITPAHDPNDFLVGKKYNLEFQNVFTDDGKINFGEFKDKKRFDVRYLIKDKLKEMDLLVDIQKHKMNIGFCSRSNDIIEPLIRPQWYLKTQEMSLKMSEMVENDEIKIHPAEFKNIWHSWMKNNKDWCISRQLWWGHRIPIWIVNTENQEGSFFKKDTIVYGSTYEEAEKHAKEKGFTDFTLIQDEDVLDTWYSSALLPISVLNFFTDPDNQMFKDHFPHSVMETGHDILFFWVSKMVLMSLLFTGQVPFKQIILHPIIRDKQGVKMSKTLGNVIDPLEIIEGATLDQLIEKLKQGNLPEKKLKQAIDQKKKEFPKGIDKLGADGLRFGLLAYMQNGITQINLDILRIIGYSQFCNKIWQAFKFLHMNTDSEQFKFNCGSIDQQQQYITQSLSNSNIFIQLAMYKFLQCYQQLHQLIQTYQFAQYTVIFQTFFRDFYCSFFLEYSKIIFQSQIIEEKQEILQLNWFIMYNLIKILHPAMPFLTEELYQYIPICESLKEQCIQDKIEQYNNDIQNDIQNNIQNNDLDQSYQLLNLTLNNIRSILSFMNFGNMKNKFDCFIEFINDDNDSQQNIIQPIVIKELIKLKSVQIINKSQNDYQNIISECVGNSVQGKIFIYINVKNYINKEEELQRLIKKQNQGKTQLESYLKKAKNKLPDEIRLENQKKIEQTEIELKFLEDSIKKIEQM